MTRLFNASTTINQLPTSKTTPPTNAKPEAVLKYVELSDTESLMLSR